jgi:transposase
MNDMLTMFERWKLDVKAVRERVYRAPTPRERERWHALWLLARGWSAIREYLTTPNLRLRLVALPAYSPDFNPDEAIWDWAREEVTANICFGTAAKVREKMDSFFAGLAKRTAEVQRRCRTALQAEADALIATANQLFAQTNHVDLTLASV